MSYSLYNQEFTITELWKTKKIFFKLIQISSSNPFNCCCSLSCSWPNGLNNTGAESDTYFLAGGLNTSLSGFWSRSSIGGRLKFACSSSSSSSSSLNWTSIPNVFSNSSYALSITPVHLSTFSWTSLLSSLAMSGSFPNSLTSIYSDKSLMTGNAVLLT